MKKPIFRTMLIAGAAAGMALCAALPVARAQDCGQDSCGQDDWYTHRPSTPEERAETAQLNREAADSNMTPAPADNAAEADYQRRLGYYRRAQDDYAAQRRNYDAQMRAYAAVQSRYRAERAAYHRNRWSGPYRAWTPDGDADLGGWSVRTVNGALIGSVSAVARSPQGRFEAIRVDLGRDGVAWIDASDLRFDRYGRVAVTDLDAGDLGRMAAERY